MLIDVPRDENAEQLCNTKRYKMAINGLQYAPTSCAKYANGTYGTVVLPDASCSNIAEPVSQPCVGVSAFKLANPGPDEWVLWVLKEGDDTPINKGHLASSQTTTYPLDGDRIGYMAIVLNVTWVNKYNQENAQHNVTTLPVYDVDSADPKTGAVFQPDKFATIQTLVPIPVCRGVPYLYNLSTESVEATGPSRGTAPTWSTPRIKRTVTRP